MAAMATDGDPRRGFKPQPAEAKTEALTPERRAELMAAAEAQYRKDSRTGSRAGSRPAVRINTSRNKVEPLEPGVKTESGVHLSPSSSASGLPAIPAPPDDRTEAISKAELRQHLKNMPSERSDTDTERREAGFDETAASDNPALEPTIPPQLDNASPEAFEGDATVAYMPDEGMPPALPGPPSEPSVDQTANDLPMPTLTAPPAPAISSDLGPPTPEPSAEGPAQPEWLGNARPVDLQRPPSGAPSEFGDIATGRGPAPLPEEEAHPPPMETSNETAAPPVETAAPAEKRRGCGGALMIISLFAIVGLAAGGTVAAMLWGPQILAAAGLGEEPAPVDDKVPASGTGDGEAPGTGSGKGAVTGNRAIEQPPADAVPQTALRVAVVDDLSESGYALAEPFGDTVTWRLRALGPFQIVKGDPITEGANLSLFLKKVSVNENDEEQVANAWCAASVQFLGEGAPGEPVQLKATAIERSPLPEIDEEVDDDALDAALHPHRYRLGGAAALGCSRTLAELIVGELKVDGPPSAPDAPAVVLPETVPPMKVVEEEPTKVDKRKRKKRKRKKRKRKRRKRKRTKHKRRR